MILTEVTNPLKDGETCRLLSKKADASEYYTHTYDPTAMIAKVRGELGLSEEVLGRFDDGIMRERCCNIISITLYVTERYCTLKILQKYLYSIHRSVKNVLKRLPGWIVRVYFDTSVEECVTKAEFGEFHRIFNAIKDSPNVEVYTYDCPSFKKTAPPETKIPIERTRTLRFLPLSDPEVNLCVVREADGIVSNLDCHNIKMYASNPDILFYLPKVLDYDIDSKFDSYSYWLRIYKIMFGREYFNNHQNLKDLLAGAFCCKLKLKREYYQASVNSLQGEITAFFSKTLDEQASEPFMSDKTYIPHPNTIGSLITNNLDEVLLQLTTGFDEILLLAMYKELISVQFVCSNDDFANIDWAKNQSERMEKIKNMLIADDKNISTIAIDWTESDSSSSSFWDLPNEIILRNEIIENFTKVSQKLVSEKIISALNITDALEKIDKIKIKVDGFNRDNYFLFIIDALLLGNIKAATALNIKVVYSGQHYVSQLLNVPYDPNLDLIYDDQPGRGGGKRKRRFSIKIKKQSRHRRKLRMRKSRRKSRR